MRTPMLLFCLLTVTFTGCVGAPDPAPVVVESPDDFDYLDEPVKSGHVHDYWQGESQLVLLDRSYGAMNGPAFNSAPSYYQKLPDLEDGTVVPQGTGTLVVDVQLRPSSESRHGDGQVKADTPNGETVVLGAVNERIEYALTPAQADAPHQQITDWSFWINFTGEDGMFLYNGGIDVTIIAVRGPDPLPVFPDHPDHWDGATQIPLFTASWTTAQTYYGPVFEGCSGYQACIGDQTPDHIVPPDADHILVRITSETPMMFSMKYHGADSLAWNDVEPVESTTTESVYRIEVGTKGDSPYAETSVWAFRFRPTNHVAAGSYEAEATVFRHADVGPVDL